LVNSREWRFFFVKNLSDLHTLAVLTANLY